MVCVPVLPAQTGSSGGEETLVLGEAGPGVPPPGPGASVSLILRMLLVLILAAAAIYGVVYFLKRASRPSGQRDPNLRLLSSVHLGSNRFVHAVAAGNRVLLLGAGDGGVNLITEIDDQDTVNAMLLEDSRKNAETVSGRFSDFKAMLRRFGVQAGNKSPGAGNIRKRRERLKGLQ
ncbi:MAG: flagellar biosynthetic protein FliO [Treponema sp.]|nr:flagellar biosynthetic protein FliO [Treponema sp.]